MAHRGRLPKLILLLFLAVIVGISALAGSYMWRLTHAYDKAVTIPVAEVFPETRPTPAQPVEPTTDPPVNILLLGSDTRGEVGDDLSGIRGQRSDTIMLVNIPGDRKSIQIMSIMRDNWVDIPGHGMDKINAAMAFGGVPLLIETIEGILGVPIDHVAIIDFDGFEGLTDALGGVTVDNPSAFHSLGVFFDEGPIHLNGENALIFVRERYSLQGGDYARVRNQQAYLKGLLNTLLSRETLTSPDTIIAAVDSISPFLTVDGDLTVASLVPLGLSLKDIRSGDVTMFTSPTLGTGTVGSASVVHPDWDGLAKIATLLQEDRLRDWQP